MTLVPAKVEVLARPDLEPYELNTFCAVPGCDADAVDDHHIWRRQDEAFRGAFWVAVRFGHGDFWQIFPARVGLCRKHHAWVTGGIGGHRAWIFLDLDAEEPHYLWLERASLSDDDWEATGPLRVPLGAARGDSRPTARGAEGETTSICPTCRLPLKRDEAKSPSSGEPKPRGPSGPKKTWAVKVPKAVLENDEDGAEVINGLLEPIAEKLGRAGHTSWKYYTLVEALVFVSQHLDHIEPTVSS